MRRTRALATIVAAAAALGSAPPAVAQNPAGCNANRLTLAIIRDKTLIKNGDVINYRVELTNPGDDACDVSHVTARLQFPQPDGNPSGALQVVAANAAYAANA